MKKLPLPCGAVTLIDEADGPLVENLTLYRSTNGYVYFSEWINGKSNPRTLHAFLMQTPKGMVTDHINGDKLDNRRSCNLRVVTQSVNGHNRTRLNKNNRSGVRGVHRRPSDGRWEAHITVNHKGHYLGIFDHIEDAVVARQRAEVELRGAV